VTLTWKHAAILGAACLIAGFLLGGKLVQPKEVIKTQLVDHDVIKDHVVTVTKEIVQKDGSKEIDTTVTDDRKQDDVKKESTVSVQPLPKVDPKWFVTVGAGIDASSLSSLGSPVYSVGVDRRILGPIYGGVWGNNKSQVGVGIGLEF
jgi:hypothetical protein